MHSNSVQGLGISFYNGDLDGACKLLEMGGLVTAPSGPGLAQDLTACSEYRRALEQSDLVLADSGLLCLWKKWVQKQDLSRISGLIFLQETLNRLDWQEGSTFWIMPDKKQADANVNWLEETYGTKINPSSLYIAPQYIKRGALDDPIMLSQIESLRPGSVFIQLGGGVQERLGIYLKENLSYKPSIYCTGAALAFLSGQQVKIPRWADRLYLGWLFRCFFKPSVFIPRYTKALRLLMLLARYGDQSPVIQD